MWIVDLFHILNMSERRSGFQSRFQSFDGTDASLGQHLNPPIRQITSPSSDPESLGLSVREPPEPDPLHSSADEEADGGYGFHWNWGAARQGRSRPTRCRHT